MTEQRKPTGFVAQCQCGVIVDAMDYERMERAEAGKLFGRWIADAEETPPITDKASALAFLYRHAEHLAGI